MPVGGKALESKCLGDHFRPLRRVQLETLDLHAIVLLYIISICMCPEMGRYGRRSGSISVPLAHLGHLQARLGL